MRIFIAVLVLIFSLQSWTKADDISDFQIEGMSVGDSLLDFYSKDKIIKGKLSDQYKSKKFYQIQIYDNNFEKYERMYFQLKEDDNKFIIYSMSGVITMNINTCIKEQKKILKNLLTLFDNPQTFDEGKRKHPAYENGYTHDVYIEVNSDLVAISCYEFTDLSRIEELLISVDTKEFNDFLENEAHN